MRASPIHGYRLLASMIALLTAGSYACKPAVRYGETFGPPASLQLAQPAPRTSAFPFAEGKREQAAVRETPPAAETAATETRDPRAIQDAIEDRAVALEELGRRIRAIRDELSGLDGRMLEAQDQLDRETANRAVEQRESALQWELAVAELSSRAQAQAQVVSQLSSRARELAAMQMTTTEVADTQSRLAQESARLDALRGELLAAKVQAERDSALQSAGMDWESRSSLRALHQRSYETRNALQEELKDLEGRFRALQDEQAELQSRLDQPDEEGGGSESAR